MDALAKYLKTVGTFLPSNEKQDILRELAEDIQAQVEEKEAELGRGLNEPEVQAILKHVGHPLVVASRYRHDTRSVAFGRVFISPVLFPAYWKVLKFNLTLTFGVVVIIFVSLFIAGQHPGVSDILSVCLYQFLIQFSVITAIFSFAEQHIQKYPDKWSAARPDAAQFGIDLAQQIERDVIKGVGESLKPKPVSRSESISIIVASVAALVWLGAIRSNPFLIFGPAAHFLALGPGATQAYPVIVVLTIVGMIRAFINLSRPDWIRFRDLARIAMDSASVGMLLVLLRGGALVVAKTPGTGEVAASFINQSIFMALGVAAIVITIVTVVNLVKFIIREIKSRKFKQASVGHQS